jgi:diaminohydroxyphosphoribosylaminopyrimidine deaminase/5-amino-6-(5-phosphoribosylamino)uracil reductase
LVHRWRSEEAAIMIGSGTAIADNPSLTVRHWKGNNPVRLLIDRSLKTPALAQIFDQQVPTIVFNSMKETSAHHLHHLLIQNDNKFIPSLLSVLLSERIQSILIEGGAGLLQSFIELGLWDEARIITNRSLQLGNGLSAPILQPAKLKESYSVLSDLIQVYQPIA